MLPTFCRFQLGRQRSLLLHPPRLLLQQQKRDLFSTAEEIIGVAALGMLVARVLQLEFRTRSQTQSLEEERSRFNDIQASLEQEKTQKNALSKENNALSKKVAKMEEAKRRLEDSIQHRGLLGEQLLQQVLEECKDQNFIEGYNLQPAISQAKKPDAAIDFFGNMTVVVDSKAPKPPSDRLLEVDDNESSSDSQQDADARRTYVENLKSHIRSLSAKKYHAELPNSLPLTWMFLPGEGYLQAAYDDRGNELHKYAEERNILLVTPNGLRGTIQFLNFWQRDAAQKQKLDEERVQETLQKNIQPLWTEQMLPGLRKFTRDLNTFVQDANRLSETTIHFDQALRAKDALDLPKARKTNLPKDIRKVEPYLGDYINGDALEQHQKLESRTDR